MVKNQNWMVFMFPGFFSYSSVNLMLNVQPAMSKISKLIDSSECVGIILTEFITKKRKEFFADTWYDSIWWYSSNEHSQDKHILHT